MRRASYWPRACRRSRRRSQCGTRTQRPFRCARPLVLPPSYVSVFLVRDDRFLSWRKTGPASPRMRKSWSGRPRQPYTIRDATRKPNRPTAPQAGQKQGQRARRTRQTGPEVIPGTWTACTPNGPGDQARHPTGELTHQAPLISTPASNRMFHENHQTDARPRP